MKLMRVIVSSLQRRSKVLHQANGRPVPQVPPSREAGRVRRHVRPKLFHSRILADLLNSLGQKASSRPRSAKGSSCCASGTSLLVRRAPDRKSVV